MKTIITWVVLDVVASNLLQARSAQRISDSPEIEIINVSGVALAGIDISMGGDYLQKLDADDLTDICRNSAATYSRRESPSFLWSVTI